MAQMQVAAEDDMSVKERGGVEDQGEGRWVPRGGAVGAKGRGSVEGQVVQSGGVAGVKWRDVSHPRCQTWVRARSSIFLRTTAPCACQTLTEA